MVYVEGSPDNSGPRRRGRCDLHAVIVQTTCQRATTFGASTLPLSRQRPMSGSRTAGRNPRGWLTGKYYSAFVALTRRGRTLALLNGSKRRPYRQEENRSEERRVGKECR